MLLRLISVISLTHFMLMLIAGTQIHTALYRSLLVFIILFTVVYLAVFLLNIIRGNHEQENMAMAEGTNSNAKKDNES